ncbi:TniB family NTP-binding protein [Ruegeria sp. SCPT10]|uniref:TniB family NTP-binding protein n=1 Tax=Ruegeria sp. SCP10 TaxID=3141377 RepID=UPI00333CC6AF
MTMNNPQIRRIVQDLRSAYVPTKAYRKLEQNFQMLLDQRRADLAEGITSNVRGIVLIGQSGSGKSTAIRELVKQNRALIASNPEEEVCEFIGLQVPSPATMKFVGAATLNALGYPYSGSQSGPVVWDMVKRQLELRRTLFLHLDEAQDLARYQTDKERQAVVNTLKFLMENSQWPVGLVLTGMPDLKNIVNQDAQLARRLYPIEIDRLHDLRHAKSVVDLVKGYTRRAGIAISDELKSESFARRLMHAADYEFGLLAELTVQSITEAITSAGLTVALQTKHFAEVFHARSAAIDGLNPFIAEDFTRIRARDVLGGVSV